MNSAVFFDRDGTLIEEVGYLDARDKLSVYPFAYEAIRLLNAKGIKVIVISNQSGVARGYFDEDFVRQTHLYLAEKMARQGARIDAFYFCPHHPRAGLGEYLQECDCRKPRAGMLLQAAKDWQIDLAHSFVVGDNITDMQAADAAGATGILVATGYGKTHQGAGYRSANNVLAATQIVLKELCL